MMYKKGIIVVVLSSSPSTNAKLALAIDCVHFEYLMKHCGFPKIMKEIKNN